MNVKTLAPLGLAAVLGLAAAMVARNMLANRPAPVTTGENVLRTVVVANTNILPGTEINSGMLISARVSKEMAPEGTFADVKQLAGRVSQAPIYKGQPVINDLLAPKGSVGGLQALVPNGMRAITLQVDEFTGVGGFLTPGCRVDLLSTMQGEKQGDMMARTVVQNIMVTAVGQRMTLTRANGEQEPPMRSVTLIATPEEAQAIELAASTGRPRLVLRNVRDENEELPDAVSLSDFKQGDAPTSYGDPFAGGSGRPIETPPVTPVTIVPTTQVAVSAPSDQAEAKPEAPRYWNVKIIRGGNESQIQVPLSQPPQKSRPARGGEPITQTEQSPVGK